MTVSVFDIFYVAHGPYYIIGQWAIIFSSSWGTSGYISLMIPCCAMRVCNAESKWWVHPISYVSNPLPLSRRFHKLIITTNLALSESDAVERFFG